MGLVKHATFVEKVWFDEAVTCRSRAEIGIPATPDESFILDDDDTIAADYGLSKAAMDSLVEWMRANAAESLDAMTDQPAAFLDPASYPHMTRPTILSV